MTKKKNIEYLYSKVKNKGKVISAIAKETGRAHNSVKNNWLNTFAGWSVPEQFEDVVISILQKAVSLGN